MFVSPATLNASTDDLTIPYGQTLTKDDLVTTFEGWAYDDPFQESEVTVFPEEDGGIPYYFVKLNEDGSETDEMISTSSRSLVSPWADRTFVCASVLRIPYDIDAALVPPPENARTKWISSVTPPKSGLVRW